MANNDKTTVEMLDEQIRATLDDLNMHEFTDDEGKIKPLLEKLKVLQAQRLEILKLDNDIAIRNRELDLNTQKLEADTAIRIREVELKEKSDKQAHEIEEAKVKEQKKANVTNAIIGGVTAGTGIAGIIATLHCFKKSMQFEETGSYTNKTGQHVGGLFNLFRRKV